MAQSDQTGSIVLGGLFSFVGEVFGHPTTASLTPGGTVSADAKETLGASAGGFPADGSPINAPASGAEAALSKTVDSTSPITAQNRPHGMKITLYIAGALALVYVLRKVA